MLYWDAYLVSFKHKQNRGNNLVDHKMFCWQGVFDVKYRDMEVYVLCCEGG